MDIQDKQQNSHIASAAQIHTIYKHIYTSTVSLKWFTETSKGTAIARIIFIYQIKITESPATSLFALTNTLHPVVRRCLFGWPKYEELDH